MSGSLYDSVRRVVAMAVVVCCHLVLLALLLRPVHGDRNTTSVVEDDPLVLKLRFVPRPQPQTSSAHSTPPPTQRSTKTQSAGASEPPSSRRAAQVTAQTSEPHSTSTPTTLDLHLNTKSPTSDGGFEDRLVDAQHSHDVHGVPGSDRPIVPGIHLIDPKNQGIGAVMRNAQRLFGITNHHCIDSEVLRHLSQEELKERHLSRHDLDQMDEKYDCNRPLGLSF